MQALLRQRRSMVSEQRVFDGAQVREEILGVLETLFPSMLNAGEFRASASVLRETRALVERKRTPGAASESDTGILAASGLVAGEGLAGVAIAGLVAAGIAPKAIDPRLGGLVGESGALLVALGICAFLLRGGQR